MCYSSNTNVFSLSSFPFLVFKNKESNYASIVTFANSYYVKTPATHTNSLFLDPQIKSISITNLLNANGFRKIGSNYINSILKSSRVFFYKRLSYSGKGYRLYIKSKSKIYFQLGYSHKYYLYDYTVTLKPILKSKLLLLASSLTQLSNFSKSIYGLRPLNIFTLKGIRFTKQLVYKKVGKVSSYR